MDRHEAETQQVQAFLDAQRPLSALAVSFRPIILLALLLLVITLTGGHELAGRMVEVALSKLTSLI